MEIDTGDTTPKKQPPRRMPFMVREEVARQLKNMQQDGVIEPSNSPLSSPVVMVQKKDGSHRFCVDYRALNSVTKADTFPLPRIADLLDQLGGARYFSTLDLVSGFWQIQMDPESREKTAFATPQGLYEFLVFAVPDQRAERIARLLCEEVVPMFGVPEALLSDQGTNLLSHLMIDVCRLLGIKKLNTTSYHPQCDGMVERFNRTLKSMLRKRAAEFGSQWDRHLPALLWAYQNAPHDATGEKPSFLLFGWDCRSPTEAALLPVSDAGPTIIEDYREELVLTLSTARETALESIQKAQRRYKNGYDRRADGYSYRVGDWVLIRFPSEETGRFRKLSRPWHGPYRVASCNNTNVTAVKVYFPREDPIQVHQLRVKPCPRGFTAGFYWYGSKRKGPGRPPRWVKDVLAGKDSPDSRGEQSTIDCDTVPVSSTLSALGNGNTMVDAAQPPSGLPLGDTTGGIVCGPVANIGDPQQFASSPDPTDSVDLEGGADAPDVNSSAAGSMTEDQVEDIEPTHVHVGISPTSSQATTSVAPSDQTPTPHLCIPSQDTRIGYSLRRNRRPPDRLI